MTIMIDPEAWDRACALERCGMEYDSLVTRTCLIRDCAPQLPAQGREVNGN